MPSFIYKGERKMNDCIFCKIVKGDIPSYKIYEDDTCISFLDISQLTKGHLLVVSKNHYSNFLEIDPEVLSHIVKVGQKIAKEFIKINPSIKGFNIINNCNEISGQSVMHFHLHIIPRYEKDEFGFIENKKEVSKKEMEEITELLKRNLTKK